jgi:hypothetical protein
MPPAEFEPALPASEWPQAYALDRAVAVTGRTYDIFNELYAEYESNLLVQGLILSLLLGVGPYHITRCLTALLVGISRTIKCSVR